MKFLVLTLLVATALAKPTLHKRGKPMPDGRIVGGNDIDISEVPWQISLEWYNQHICGGSVISENYVVTAAHCTEGSTASDFTIRAGTSTRESGGQTVEVAAIHQNPDFDDWIIDYDISILELATPLVLGDNVAAVKLPTDGQTWDAGTEVLVTGWGTLHEGDSDLPLQLQGVTVQLVSNEECSAAYSDYPVTERMICAGVPEGGKDSCQGDSGGPLVIDGVLGGIVSWGLGCAEKGYPGVYSSVAALRSYITEITGM